MRPLILLLPLLLAAACTADPGEPHTASYEAPPYSLLETTTTEEWTDAHQAAFEAYTTGLVLAELAEILSTTTTLPPTTFAPPTTVTKAPPPTAAPRASGSVWDDLAWCESGGNWAHADGDSFDGGLQFHTGTWRAYGGTVYADRAYNATRAQQIEIAEKVLADVGWGAWPGCSRKLGLR